MRERDPSVRLPQDIARCAASRCTMISRCARARALIGQRTACDDFSEVEGGGTALCVMYIDAAGVRKARP